MNEQNNLIDFLNNYELTVKPNTELALSYLLPILKNLPVREFIFYKYSQNKTLESFYARISVEFTDNIQSKTNIRSVNFEGEFKNGLKLIKEEFITLNSFLTNDFFIEKINFCDCNNKIKNYSIREENK